MVTFRLIEENAEYLTYWYYPEGREENSPGIITVDREKGEISVSKLAEGDWEREVPPEEINEMVDTVNRLAGEEGEPLEHVSRPERKRFYADHAIREIAERLGRGELPKRGRSVWY